MTESELIEAVSAIQAQFRDETIPDKAIILQIRELPELVHAKLLSGANLFLSAVLWNRFPAAMALAIMGADIHWTCKASLFSGNALNVAHTPQQADQLLAMGVQIERNLLLSQPFQNPAVMAASHNDTVMLLYWLKKQRELFAEDEGYIRALYYAAIDMVSMMNQYHMLACVIADGELFGILKDIYSKTDNAGSIRLYLGALRHIADESLEGRKKELRKILNARKRELSSMA